jgi:hypothetical protein
MLTPVQLHRRSPVPSRQGSRDPDRAVILLSSFTRPGLEALTAPHPGGAEAAAALLERWRVAQGRLAALAETESMLADDPPMLPCPPALQSRVQDMIAEPSVQQAFDLTPVTVALVEIDSLMVADACAWASDLQAWQPRALAAARDDAHLGALCLSATERDDALRAAPNRRGWQLVSSSRPVRVLGQQAEQTPQGQLRLTTVLGVPPPVVHAVRFGGRLLLVDGLHRARALRSCGVAYMPCLVSVCADLREVAALVPGMTVDRLQPLFDAPRPPLMRDFDRHRMVGVATVPRRAWRVEATWPTIDGDWLP